MTRDEFWRVLVDNRPSDEVADSCEMVMEEARRRHQSTPADRVRWLMERATRNTGLLGYREVY